MSCVRESKSWHREGIRCSTVEPVKVLFLTHSFPRYPGDAPGSFLLRLATALADESVKVHVIAPAAPGLAENDEIEGITLERFRYAPREHETLAYTGTMAQDVARSWKAKLAMVSYLGGDLARAISVSKSFQPDIIHAHWWFPSGVIGQWVSKLTGTPLVTTLHGTDVRMAKAIPASRPIFRAVLKRSARVTTVSRWLASEVSDLMPDAQPDVAPMPVNVAKFMPSGTRHKNRFLFAGRLNKQKGLEHLLRAAASMTRPAMIDVVGEGSEAASLRLLASQLGVSDRVVWHGQMTQDGLVKMYQTATAVVVPSTDEGLGLVAAEAQLCEAPVVAFRSGGLTDVVEHDRTGILVTPADVGELARALDEMLRSPGHAANLGRAGREFALTAFSPESAARKYSALYRSVIGDRAQ